jgi:hypothetical protein
MTKSNIVRQYSYGYYYVVFLFLISTFALLMIGGGPVTNDELKYIQASMFDSAEPRLLNRYAHIYIQKLAIWISGDVIGGFQLMWAVLISATSVSIYWSIQVLTKWANPFLGLLGILVFLAQPLVFRFVGVTYVDFTVMSALSISLAIYLNQTQIDVVNRSSALFLGVLFLIAIKSKEPGAISILFLAGLLVQFYENKQWVTLLFYWLIGVLISFAFLICADAYFLGDFLFSISKSNVGALVDFNTGDRIRINANWFSILTTSAVFMPFIFYLLSSFSNKDTKKFEIKIVYLIPIAFIFLITLAMVFGRVRAIPRYIIPIIPILSVLSIVYLENIGAFKKRVFHFTSRSKWLFVLILIIAIPTIFYFFKDKTTGVMFNGWTPKLFLYDIFYPTLIMVLFSVFILFRKESLFRIRATILLFFIGIAPMLLFLPNNLLYTSIEFDERSEPIKIFMNKLELAESTRILITPSAAFTKRGSFVGALLPLYLKEPFECVHVQDNYPMVCKKPEDKFYSEPLNSNWKSNIKVDYIIATTSDMDRWKIADEFENNNNSIIRDGNYALVCFNKNCLDL